MRSEDAMTLEAMCEVLDEADPKLFVLPLSLCCERTMALRYAISWLGLGRGLIPTSGGFTIF